MNTGLAALIADLTNEIETLIDSTGDLISEGREIEDMARFEDAFDRRTDARRLIDIAREIRTNERRLLDVTFDLDLAETEQRVLTASQKTRLAFA